MTLARKSPGLDLGAATVATLDGRVLDPASRDAWLAAAPDLLAPAELERFLAYLVPEKRLELLLGRVLVRALLSERFGLPPRTAIDAPEGAKPRLAGRAGGPFFNLAHSHGAVAVIASADHDVAIDIERIRPVSDGLVEATLVGEELRAFRAEASDLARFFRIWTAKEAFMKLGGDGLRIPPRRLRVDLARRVVLDLDTGASHELRGARRGDLVMTWIVGPGGG